MTLLRKTPALRVLCLATPLLLLGACGGGGGSSNSSSTDNGPLVVDFSYPTGNNLGYEALAPMTMSADIGGLNGNTPHCAIQSGQLPAGITLNSGDCSLAGTPEETGQFSATVRLTVSGYSGYVDAPISIEVNRLTFMYGFDVAGVAWGTDFATTTPSWSQWWPDSGDSVTYRLDPATSAAGLSIDASTGVISGHVEGSAGQIDVKAYADIVHAGHTLTAETVNEVLTVNTPNVFYDSSVTGRVGQAVSIAPTGFSVDFASLGYTLSYAVDANLSTCDLAPGLSLNASTGTISGTPAWTWTCDTAIRWTASKGGQQVTGYFPINFYFY